jgi:hypothetical protein
VLEGRVSRFRVSRPFSARASERAQLWRCALAAPIRDRPGGPGSGKAVLCSIARDAGRKPRLLAKRQPRMEPLGARFNMKTPCRNPKDQAATLSLAPVVTRSPRPKGTPPAPVAAWPGPPVPIADSLPGRRKSEDADEENRREPGAGRAARGGERERALRAARRRALRIDPCPAARCAGHGRHESEEPAPKDRPVVSEADGPLR